MGIERNVGVDHMDRTREIGFWLLLLLAPRQIAIFYKAVQNELVKMPTDLKKYNSEGWRAGNLGYFIQIHSIRDRLKYISA